MPRLRSVPQHWLVTAAFLAAIDRLRLLRRTWLGSAGSRFYFAWIDGRPAPEAALYWRDDLADLESVGTLPWARAKRR